MKSTLNHACISALLCGAVLVAIPAVAQNADAGAGANANAGASTSAGGMTTSGDINSATAGNNAGSVNTAAQTPAHHMSKKTQRTANAAEVETTRQLNQEAAANAKASTTAQ